MNHNADIKPSLIDLEASNMATGGKQESTDSMQPERLSEKDNVYIVYWIRLDKHTDPFKEGYIGITKDFKERMKAHRKSKRKYVINNSIRKYGWVNLHKDILNKDLTLREALLLEGEYRTSQNVGWNLQKGGELGVESTWYEIKENKISHARATSKGTKLGIKLKDSKGKRSQRAKQNRARNKASYKGITTGSSNGKALLNEEQVKNIKCGLIPSGMTNRQIGDMFGVKPYVIAFIKSGKTWKHVICDSPDHK